MSSSVRLIIKTFDDFVGEVQIAGRFKIAQTWQALSVVLGLIVLAQHDPKRKSCSTTCIPRTRLTSTVNGETFFPARKGPVSHILKEGPERIDASGNHYRHGSESNPWGGDLWAVNCRRKRSIRPSKRDKRLTIPARGCDVVDSIAVLAGRENATLIELV